jgi:UDP-glucose 4-epimerase
MRSVCENSQKTMRALVTGGGGFIGSHLVSLLLKAGAEVVVFDRDGGARPTHAGSVHYVSADLLNRAAISTALAGVDVVFHLAWSGIPRSSNEDSSAHVSLNLVPTLVLFDACINLSVRRVVFLSSGGAVYGSVAELPITEEHPTRPISAYGVTKLAAEAYLEFYSRQHNLDYVILRPSVPYGEAQNIKRGQGAVGVFLNSAITGEPITLWGGRNIARDFFYVGDLAKACLAAAHETVERGVYNIGGGRAITLGHLLDLVQDVTHTRLNVKVEPSRSFDPPSIVLDITRARHCLGWEPEVSILAGVERTWKWLRPSRQSETGTLASTVSSIL